MHYDKSCKTLSTPSFTTVSKTGGYVRAPIINLSYKNIDPSNISKTIKNQIIPNTMNERYDVNRRCVAYKNVVRPNPMPVLAATAQSRNPSEYNRRNFLDYGEAALTGYKQYPFGRIDRPTPGSIYNTQEFETLPLRKF